MAALGSDAADGDADGRVFKLWVAGVRLTGLRRGLNEIGYVEGRYFVIETIQNEGCQAIHADKQRDTRALGQVRPCPQSSASGKALTTRPSQKVSRVLL